MRPIIHIFSSNLSNLNTVKEVFEKECFEIYLTAAVSEEVIKKTYRINPDIVLLDLDIDNSDGIELCQRFKSESALDSFVVLFTPHDDEYIQLEAFKAGADDYIVRPINHRLLLKKIATLLKRKQPILKRVNPDVLSYNSIVVDRERYLVYINDVSFTFPRKEFEMIYLLINTPQKVFSREEIFQQVWKQKECVNFRIIDVHIRKIREKIGQNIINTVKGVGYQLA